MRNWRALSLRSRQLVNLHTEKSWKIFKKSSHVIGESHNYVKINGTNVKHRLLNVKKAPKVHKMRDRLFDLKATIDQADFKDFMKLDRGISLLIH